MKIFTFLLVLILFISCDDPSIGHIKSTNSNFDVRLLFEADGCKVYTFWAYGQRRFFCNCNGAVMSTSNDKDKKDQTIPTISK